MYRETIAVDQGCAEVRGWLWGGGEGGGRKRKTDADPFRLPQHPEQME